MTKDENDLEKMSLLSHLIELRKRLLTVTIVFLLLFFLCFIKFTDNNQNFADLVYVFLQQPLADKIAQTGGRMIFTALHEGFFTQVKVAFFISMTIAFPILLIQLWKFIAPGLYKNEKMMFLPFLIATPILFFLGGCMVYYIVIPLAWDFFISFQISALIDMDSKIICKNVLEDIVFKREHVTTIMMTNEDNESNGLSIIKVVKGLILSLCASDTSHSNYLLYLTLYFIDFFNFLPDSSVP